MLWIAIQFGKHGWEEVKERFRVWIESYPIRAKGYLWMYRRRLAWLLRKIHAENGIPEVAKMMRSANQLSIWGPWILALDALVDPKAIRYLQDPKSLNIYRILTQTVPPGNRNAGNEMA
jgi:hypothetical protein